MCGCCRLAVVLISARKRSAPRMARQLGAQHLERDLAVVAQVVGQVDGGHAAGAELALDPVAVGEGGGQAREGIRHHKHLSQLHQSGAPIPDPRLKPRLGLCHSSDPGRDDPRRAMSLQRQPPTRTPTRVAQTLQAPATLPLPAPDRPNAAASSPRQTAGCQSCHRAAIIRNSRSPGKTSQFWWFPRRS